jgi:hypothetical protein
MTNPRKEPVKRCVWDRQHTGVCFAEAIRKMCHYEDCESDCPDYEPEEKEDE